MMEALVNNDYDAWLEQLKVETPGSDKQFTQFETLYQDFQHGLTGVISPEVVYGICKAVTATPELRKMAKNRALEVSKGGSPNETPRSTLKEGTEERAPARKLRRVGMVAAAKRQVANSHQ